MKYTLESKMSHVFYGLRQTLLFCALAFINEFLSFANPNGELVRSFEIVEVEQMPRVSEAFVLHRLLDYFIL